MVKAGAILVILAVLLAGVFVFRHFFPSEQRQVRERYEELSRWVSMGTEENVIKTAQRMRHLQPLFADTCIIKAHPEFLSGTYGPREVATLAAGARAHFRELSLRFYDMDIRFPSRWAATVTLTARLRGGLKSGDIVDEIREVESELKKVDRKWRFTRIEVVEVLEK